MADRDRDGGFLSGLVLGALIGAGLVYFLTSTEEGKKVKKQLKKKGKDTLDNLAETISEFEEKGEEFRKKAEKLQAALEEKTKDIREEVGEEAKEQLTHIDKLRERGRKATKKFFTKNGKSLA